jgi:predicted nucleic acid-binding protein
MKKRLVLDSSVLVAGIKQDESKHSECRKLLQMIHEGKYFAIEPYTVLVEVVAAIRRRSGSESLAERVGNDLIDMDNIEFLEIVEGRAIEALKIALKSSLRGMDAIVIQVCKELGAPLVTLDEEMADKGKDIIEIKEVVELI